jgi:hypothetical protein
MKLISITLLIGSFLLLAACGSRPQERMAESSADRVNQDRPPTTETKRRQHSTEGFIDESERPIAQPVSLNQADQSQSMAEAMNRKILRNSDLTLEVSDPSAAQRQITSIAETAGGFVISSEAKQRQIEDSRKQELELRVVVRVPAAQFISALEQIRAQGNRVIEEKTTGQDVTEEFIDLEARIKTQKALELQFLEIMKQANKVADALEVQRQIADVRTEIEKLEGRKRFLENRASLSTISINLQTPAAIAVSTSSFGRNVRQAVGDSVSVATGIVLFLIRFVIVMVPICILILIPGGLLARYIFRKVKRMQLSPQSSSASE